MRRKHPRHCSKFIDDIINIFTVRQHQCHWHWQRHYVATSIHKWMTMSRSKRLMINMDTNCNGIPFCQRILHMIEMLPVLNVLYRQLRLNLCEFSPPFSRFFLHPSNNVCFFLTLSDPMFSYLKKKTFRYLLFVLFDSFHLGSSYHSFSVCPLYSIYAPIIWTNIDVFYFYYQ